MGKIKKREFLKYKNQENMHKHETLEITDNIEFDFELIQENSNNWNIFLNIITTCYK